MKIHLNILRLVSQSLSTCAVLWGDWRRRQQDLQPPEWVSLFLARSPLQGSSALAVGSYFSGPLVGLISLNALVPMPPLRGDHKTFYPDVCVSCPLFGCSTVGSLEDTCGVNRSIVPLKTGEEKEAGRVR